MNTVQIYAYPRGEDRTLGFIAARSLGQASRAIKSNMWWNIAGEVRLATIEEISAAYAHVTMLPLAGRRGYAGPEHFIGASRLTEAS